MKRPVPFITFTSIQRRLRGASLKHSQHTSVINHLVLLAAVVAAASAADPHCHHHHHHHRSLDVLVPVEVLLDLPKTTKPAEVLAVADVVVACNFDRRSLNDAGKSGVAAVTDVVVVVVVAAAADGEDVAVVATFVNEENAL